MHIQTIRSIAKNQGLKIGKSNKAELIRSIQRNEGNFDCFGSASSGYCDQFQCSWREDCLPAPNRKSAATPSPRKSTARAKAS